MLQAYKLTGLFDMSSLDDVRFYGVLHDSIELVWSDIEYYLDEALKVGRGEHTKAEIFNFLKCRDMQLWVAYNNEGCLAMCITQITYHKKDKRMTLLYVGGEDIEKWMFTWHIIMDWAKEQGCTACRIYGRDGWKRKLKHLGAKQIHAVLEVTL